MTLAASMAQAQHVATGSSAPLIRNALRPIPVEQKTDIGTGFRRLVENLDAIDGFLERAVVARAEGDGLPLFRDWKLLDDLNLRLKAFAPEKGSAGLGISYDFQEGIPAHYFQDRSGTKSAVDFAFKARGNVAFDKSTNVEDFLDTKIHFRFVHSRGGVTALPVPKPRTVTHSQDDIDSEIFTEVEKLPDDQGFTIDPEVLHEIELLLVDKYGGNFDAMTSSPEWKTYLGMVRPRLSTQYYAQVGFDGGIESDQDFGEIQWTAGAKLGLGLKAWNQDSAWAHLNIFDYPFALIRLLSGYDKSWSPDGLSWPSLIVGYDRVMPDSGDPRSKAGDSSDFDRLSGEIWFRTPVARFGGTRVYFDADFRYFRDLGASRAIERANLAEFTYVQIALTSSQGFFVSFGHGQLPFDQRNEAVYQVGWKVNTDQLRGLLD
jgi:hypothetical protein